MAENFTKFNFSVTSLYDESKYSIIFARGFSVILYEPEIKSCDREWFLFARPAKNLQFTDDSNGLRVDGRLWFVDRTTCLRVAASSSEEGRKCLARAKKASRRRVLYARCGAGTRFLYQNVVVGRAVGRRNGPSPTEGYFI